MSGFLNRPMIFSKHTLISLPEVAVGISGSVGFGDARPKLAATIRAPVACEPGHDLPGAAAEGDLLPTGVGL